MNQFLGQKTQFLISIVFMITVFFFQGCSISNWPLPIKNIPHQESLRDIFIAANGQYFPKSIHNTFKLAKDFERDHPTISLAQQGVRLIEVKQINPNHHLQQNESNLSWSADGTYLSYEVDDQYKKRIILGKISGTPIKELSIHPPSDKMLKDHFISLNDYPYNAGLSWSYDNTRYAFMSNGGAGQYNIFVGAIDLPEFSITGSTSKDGMARWNPVSNKIAFVSGRTGNGDIYLFDLSKNDLNRLTDSDKTDLFPEWSSDGKTIYFCRGHSTNYQIASLTFLKNKGKFRYLTNNTMTNLRPKVSPNGRLVSFYGKKNRLSQLWNIYVLPTSATNYTDDQTNQALIATDIVINLTTGPTWSPDSQKIFYVKRDAQKFNPIFSYDLYTRKSQQLKTQTVMNSDLMISSLGVLSFRAQVGVWDRVFIALTNQGNQIQTYRLNSTEFTHHNLWEAL